jgi:hypothetical protein
MFAASLFQLVIRSSVSIMKIAHTCAQKLTCGGRARWKIENETFNTLKNQGYQFEHNFGHGKQNLSCIGTCFASLCGGSALRDAPHLFQPAET